MNSNNIHTLAPLSLINHMYAEEKDASLRQRLRERMAEHLERATALQYASDPAAAAAAINPLPSAAGARGPPAKTPPPRRPSTPAPPLPAVAAKAAAYRASIYQPFVDCMRLYSY